MRIPRLLLVNRVKAAAAARRASSTDPAHALSWLLDQMRSKAWRSRSGWTIVAGFNDRIDFNRGGVKVATIAAGTYATAALFAAAVVAALEAADATPAWACSYSGSTFKFTISSDIPFTLLFESGANISRGAAKELGFNAADTSSATSHTGNNAVYQSRHFITIDQGSALSLQAGVALNHNLSASGTIALQANATDSWSAPTVNEALSVVLDDPHSLGAGRLKFLSGEQTLRWIRFLVDDCGNGAGYNEIGVLFAGPYYEHSSGYGIAFQDERDDLSIVHEAVHGANHQDERPTKRRFDLEWSELPTGRDQLRAALALAPKGRDFFFAFDAVTNPADTIYCYRSSGVKAPAAGPGHYSISFSISEAMP